MSGVYPYCVMPAGCHPPVGLTGLGGRPVEAHDMEAFTVWTSAEDGPPPLDLEAITRHHAVVRAATEHVTPLPVRFGAWAADHSVLVSRIHRYQGELEAALAAVAGCLEYGVTIEGISTEGISTPAPGGGERPAAGDGERPAPAGGNREAPATGAGSGAVADGRAYLRELSREYAALRRRREERDVLLAELRAAIAGVTIDERIRPIGPSGLVSVAHLVARRLELRYRERIAAFEREHGSGRVSMTGPWPPYSFAGS